ncbi:MAG: hypothetical protein AAGG09_15705 [Pseudomonadota bacterium]
MAHVAATEARLDRSTVGYHPALALAATLPNEDLAGFAVATALLLADRLQHGAGPDDLYWHYDAHRTVYRSLPPDTRSAILMGFALLHDMRCVTLEDPPAPDERSARPETLVRSALAAAPADVALAFGAALDGAGADASERLWRETAHRMVETPALNSAARHLYTTRSAWDPYRDWPDARIAAEGIAIPFPCTLPVPHGPD